MPDIEREPCPACGEPAAASASVCPFCGRSLLVAIEVRSVPEEGRDRYQLARALAALGPPVPSFLEVQRSLVPRGTLVSGIPREATRRILSTLEEGGGRGEVVAVVEAPVAPAPAASSFPWRPVVPAALVLCGVAWLALRDPSPEAPPPTSGAAPAASAPLAAAERAHPASTRELAELATPSTVTLRCSDSVGTGFFVAPERVLTNAHVLCPDGGPLAVLADGSEVRAETLVSDEWLDLAVVRVPGATAAPLPLGDATRLRSGDRIVVVGTPEGLEHSVHEGIVSHAGRNVMGLVYLQLGASVNPGSSGGPVLDANGRVVGIVSAKVQQAEGLGFGLPINYAYDGAATFVAPPTPGPDRRRWSELLAAAEKADAEAVAELNDATSRTVLLGIQLMPGVGFVAFVMRRDPGPVAEPISVLVRHGEEPICRMPGLVRQWEPMSADVSGAADARHRAWMERHHLTSGLYRGFGPVDAGACPEGAFEGATFVIES